MSDYELVMEDVTHLVGVGPAYGIRWTGPGLLSQSLGTTGDLNEARATAAKVARDIKARRNCDWVAWEILDYNDNYKPVVGEQQHER